MMASSLPSGCQPNGGAGTAVLGLNNQSHLRVGLPDSDGQPTALKLASGERPPIQRSVPQRDAVTGLQNV